MICQFSRSNQDLSRSIKLHGSLLWAALFRFSIRFRSELWLGHSEMLIFSSEPIPSFGFLLWVIIVLKGNFFIQRGTRTSLCGGTGGLWKVITQSCASSLHTVLWMHSSKSSPGLRSRKRAWPNKAPLLQRWPLKIPEKRKWPCCMPRCTVVYQRSGALILHGKRCIFYGHICLSCTLRENYELLNQF